MRHSNLIVSAAVAIGAIFGIGAASAADLPARTYTKAPVVVDPGYNWSGWYVGLNAGGDWGTANTQTVVPGVFGPPFYTTALTQTVKPSGFIGGAQAGYNFQVNPSWLLGVEADIQGTNFNQNLGLNFVPIGASTLVSNTRVSSDWLATVRGRIGWTSGGWLVYGTGGLAVTNVKYSQNNLFLGCAGPGGTCIEGASVNQTKAGWTAGGGLEFAINQNWSVKGEYLFARFNGVSATGLDNAIASTFLHSTGSLDMNIVRLGVNYRWGGPVVARY